MNINKQFSTKTGIQGNEIQLTEAIIMYYKGQHQNETYDEMQKRKMQTCFAMTWEDSISNLSKVLTRVKNLTECPEIIAQKITNVIRKGRRDIYTYKR